MPAIATCRRPANLSRSCDEQHDDHWTKDVLRQGRRGCGTDERTDERQTRHRQRSAKVRADLAKVGPGGRCGSKDAGHLVGTERLNTRTREPQQQCRDLKQPSPTGNRINPARQQRGEGKPDQDIEIDHVLRPNE
jgi:hypothetical protein